MPGVGHSMNSDVVLGIRSQVRQPTFDGSGLENGPIFAIFAFIRKADLVPKVPISNMV